MNLDRPIGDIFVEEGYVTREQLSQILAEREDTTERLGDLLVRKKLITDKQRLKCEGLQMGVPFVDLARMELDPAVSRIIPHTLAVRLLAVPVEKTDVAASIAMVNPLDLAALDELAAISKLDVDPLLATEEDVRDAIFRTFGAYDDLGEIVGEAIHGTDIDGLRVAAQEDEEPLSVIELKEVVEGAPVIRLANALMLRAISLRASDIHIEPLQRRVRVRVRIDGLLQEIMSIPKDLQLALTSRIKILTSLDIAERRAPQDGRCTLVAPQGEFDFRVSTYPTVFGETIVIRILDKNVTMIDLGRLGMPEVTYRKFVNRLEEPQGLVLVTGPTGSGKTTSLYAALHFLNNISRNIITIEDPVEYRLEGISQANVNDRAGVSFALGLRSILRQDPDVILVGEVRDAETAAIAVEASLTGHLVLTSLHANDSAAAVTRLADMGVEHFLLAPSLNCSIAQRLLRQNCPKCKEPYTPDPEVLSRLELPPEGMYQRGRGCEHCAKTGYRGRFAVYEMLDATAEIRRLIGSGATSTDIRTVSHANGASTVRQEACRRAQEGVTTVEEVIRVTAESR
jgi:type IV pilus assembly protein PilB